MKKKEGCDLILFPFNFPTSFLCLSSLIPTLLSLPTWPMPQLTLPSKKRSGGVDDVVEGNHDAKKASLMRSTSPWIDRDASLANMSHEFEEHSGVNMSTEGCSVLVTKSWKWERKRISLLLQLCHRVLDENVFNANENILMETLKTSKWHFQILTHFLKCFLKIFLRK